LKIYNGLEKMASALLFAGALASSGAILYLHSQYHKTGPRNNLLVKEYVLTADNLKNLRGEWKDNAYTIYSFPASTPDMKKELTDNLAVLDAERKSNIKNTIDVLVQDSTSIANNSEYQALVKEEAAYKKDRSRKMAIAFSAGLLTILLTSIFGRYASRKKNEVHYRRVS
jgi:hypothetical protein